MGTKRAPKEDIRASAKGPGIYENRSPVLLEGETSFWDDVMQYSID